MSTEKRPAPRRWDAYPSENYMCEIGHEIYKGVSPKVILEPIEVVPAADYEALRAELKLAKEVAVQYDRKFAAGVWFTTEEYRQLCKTERELRAELTAAQAEFSKYYELYKNKQNQVTRFAEKNSVLAEENARLRGALEHTWTGEFGAIVNAFNRKALSEGGSGD